MSGHSELRGLERQRDVIARDLGISLQEDCRGNHEDGVSHHHGEGRREH